jgi:phosphoribosyl 1,2-cyclic phosphodiesterase
MRFEPFTVEHSTRCPAVGYRVTAGRVSVFYVPDVVYIHDRAAALAGVKLYVGDAASLSRPLIRKRGERLIGHSPVRRQLAWCDKEGVGRALFTHCGSPIVADHNAAARKIREWGQDRGVDARLAYDNLELILR